MSPNKKQVFFSVVLVLWIAGSLEITLRLSALVSPKSDRLLADPYRDVVSDKRLGHRPAPAYPGHDSKGFRNPELPAKADIIALGDSQTYGYGVEPEEAWPRQLEAIIGKTVYSMAYGGYGPAHSLILWDEAVALQPKIVLQAFYAGNDLFDSFVLVYNRDQLPELKSSDPQLQASVQQAEQSEPIAKRASRINDPRATNVENKSTTVSHNAFSLPRLLSQQSKLYGLVRRIRYEFTRMLGKSNKAMQEKWEGAQALAKAHAPYRQEFSYGRFKTVFMSEYRLTVLDLGDSRIAEGLQISLRALQRMHELSAARNIRFLVLLIPTKETVFRRLWRGHSMSYQILTKNEERFWTITKDFLEQNGIEYLDALPVLREYLATGIQPYHVSADGHPNKQGHRAMAKLLAAHLDP